MYSDWEDVTSSGRAFQVFGPATGYRICGKKRSDVYHSDTYNQIK